MNESLKEMGIEIEGEAWEKKNKNFHAQSLGSLGGKARAKNLTNEQLREIAMKGVEARKLKKLNKIK